MKRKITSTDHEVYKILSVNPIVKKSLDLNFNIQDHMVKERSLAFESGKNLLLEFCRVNGRMPTETEKYKNFKLGMWLHSQKNMITSVNDQRYKDLAVNAMIKRSLDINLGVIDPWEERKLMLFEFCDTNQRIPKDREEYKGYKVHAWLKEQKTKMNSVESEIYRKLSQNEFVKQSLDKCLEMKKKLKK